MEIDLFHRQLWSSYRLRVIGNIGIHLSNAIELQVGVGKELGALVGLRRSPWLPAAILPPAFTSGTGGRLRAESRRQVLEVEIFRCKLRLQREALLARINPKRSLDVA